jgi:2-C-methyl-D-erythritol 2,4-cyclodiphosphate synthase
MIGFGYDSHRFKEGGELIIGGVAIESEYGVMAHSDGDVLLHALIDALLGATGKGDIGTLFPDTDSKFKNIASSILIKETIAMISDYSIINIDATILLEKPKLADYKLQIKENVAALCGIATDKVNIKAKTNERMGFVGRIEGLSCYCVVQVEKLK